MDAINGSDLVRVMYKMLQPISWPAQMGDTIALGLGLGLGLVGTGPRERDKP